MALVGKPSMQLCLLQYLGLKPLMNSRKAFIVSARFTVMPQIMRISLGLSSVSYTSADRGTREDAGIKSWSASEEKLVLVECTWAVHSGPCIGEAH